MASLNPLLMRIKRPRVVTLAVPPTNQAAAFGPEHNVPPAQLPALLCQISGVVPWAVITKESFDTGKRSALMAMSYYFDFPIVGTGFCVRK